MATLGHGTERGLRARLRALVRRKARSESGFTLVELVIAMFLLAVVMSACLYSIMQGLTLSRDTQSRVVASNLITGVLEKLRTQSLTTAGFNSISVTSNSLPSQTLNGVTYKFVETNEWVNRGVSSSVCNSGTNASLILRSTVTAGWGGSGQSVSESTLIAPPNGVMSSSNGALPVQVDSSTEAGFAGASVTATATTGNPPTTQTIVTGSDGCAFFAQLPPGTYNLSISSAGGVDSQEQPTYTATAAVSAGQETTGFLGAGAVNYDLGGYISWTYNPTTPAAALGMPISVASSSQGLTDHLYSYANTSTLNPVYPANYTSVFAGGCTDADPGGLDVNNNPFYPSATENPLTVAPGGTATTTVPLYNLKIEMVDSANHPITNASSPGSTPPTAVAGATSTPGGGACPNGAPTYTLSPVSNDGTVSTSSTGVGLGHLQISVTVTEGSSTTYTGTAYVWVRPDGVYAYDPVTGAVGTEYYSFASPGAVPVTVG